VGLPGGPPTRAKSRYSLPSKAPLAHCDAQPIQFAAELRRLQDGQAHLVRGYDNFGT